MGFRPSVRLGDAIPGVLAKWKEELDSSLRKISAVWQSTVGQEVARHATPLSFREGTLVVSVDSTVWAAELSAFHSEKIAQALNAALGWREIQRVRFLSRVSTRRVSSGGEEYGEERGEI
jgi:predicted nucleic acid-binding Zn ribbon protein